MRPIFPGSRQGTPEERKTYHRAYYLAHKDKITRYNREYSKKWKSANRERARLTAKKSDLRVKYGLSLDDHNRMCKEREGKCDICHEVPNGKKWAGVLHIDHCHESKKIRGLLCTNCNRGLGMFKDDPARLEAAADYVRRHVQGRPKA